VAARSIVSTHALRYVMWDTGDCFYLAVPTIRHGLVLLSVVNDSRCTVSAYQRRTSTGIGIPVGSVELPDTEMSLISGHFSRRICRNSPSTPRTTISL